MSKLCFLLAVTPFLFACATPQPKKSNVAHRGASAYAPEHTLDAYGLALEQGADYVEQDLQISKDSVLVCLHDRTLERTTDVEQVFPDRFQRSPGEESRKIWPVSDFTLEEIKQLDAGSWFDERFAGSRVPTFEEAIELVRGKAGLYPELKDPEYYSGLGVDMAALVLEALANQGLGEPDADPATPVILQSFHPTTLERLAKETRLPLVLLVGWNQRLWLGESGLERAARFAAGIGPSKELLEEYPEAVAGAQKRGLTVTPYTFRADRVDDRFPDVTAEMRHFLYELGVDALFTDNPDLFPRR